MVEAAPGVEGARAVCDGRRYRLGWPGEACDQSEGAGHERTVAARHHRTSPGLHCFGAAVPGLVARVVAAQRARESGRRRHRRCAWLKRFAEAFAKLLFGAGGGGLAKAGPGSRRHRGENRRGLRPHAPRTAPAGSGDSARGTARRKRASAPAKREAEQKLNALRDELFGLAARHRGAPTARQHVEQLRGALAERARGRDPGASCAGPRAARPEAQQAVGRPAPAANGGSVGHQPREDAILHPVGASIMSRLLITTVGTSLLTNSDRPWGAWNVRRGDLLVDQQQPGEEPQPRFRHRRCFAATVPAARGLVAGAVQRVGGGFPFFPAGTGAGSPESRGPFSARFRPFA